MKKLAMLSSVVFLMTVGSGFAADMKAEIPKVAAAYEQNFNKQDAAGITSLFTKNYLRVSQNGIEPDNTKYYEGAFKAGMNHLEITTKDIQLLGSDMAVATGEAKVTGKNDKGEAVELNFIWTGNYVNEDGKVKIRVLTSAPRAEPAPTVASK